MPSNDEVWRAIYAKVQALEGVEIKVGVVGSNADSPAEGTAGEFTLAQLAALHEFGERLWWATGGEEGVPERSFIRATFEQQRDKLREMNARIARGVLTEKIGVDDALDLLGAWAVSAIKATIRAHIAPPLKPATIARKGSSTPLIDTAQLINGISWERAEVGS